MTFGSEKATLKINRMIDVIKSRVGSRRRRRKIMELHGPSQPELPGNLTAAQLRGLLPVDVHGCSQQLEYSTKVDEP